MEHTITTEIYTLPEIVSHEDLKAWYPHIDPTLAAKLIHETSFYKEGAVMTGPWFFQNYESGEIKVAGQPEWNTDLYFMSNKLVAPAPTYAQVMVWFRKHGINIFVMQLPEWCSVYVNTPNTTSWGPETELNHFDGYYVAFRAGIIHAINILKDGLI